jgi:hypothetical protein
LFSGTESELEIIEKWCKTHEKEVNEARDAASWLRSNRGEKGRLKKLQGLARLLSSGLNQIAQIYPVVGRAYFFERLQTRTEADITAISLTFKLILDIDDTRRGNDDRVVTLICKIQEMNATLIECA